MLSSAQVENRKTASFLGSAGASLVDLDDLFSSNPKPKQRPLVNTLVAQTQAIGKDRENASLWVTNTIFDEGFMWNYFVVRLIQTDAWSTSKTGKSLKKQLIQMCSTTLQLRQMERVGDSMSDKNIGLYGTAYCDYVFCLTTFPPWSRCIDVVCV